jgi:hypothetical protein
VSRSHFANDAPEFAPEPASLAVEPVAFAGNADVLTGKAARYDVNTPAPRSAVKTAHVGPNRERLEASIVLSLRQNGCGEGITFNCAQRSPPEEVSPEYASTSAREKSQLIHAAPSNGNSSESHRRGFLVLR